MKRGALGALVLAAAGLAILGTGGSSSAPSGRFDAAHRAAERPRGTVYVVDGREDRVLVVDAQTGRRRTVRPPGLAKCGPGLHVTGGRLVYVGTTRTRSVAYAVDPRRRGRPRKLGGAHELVPSDEPGRVWLAAIPRCRNVKRLRSVHEVTVRGEVTFRSRGPVPGMHMVGALTGALVLQRSSGALVVWEPESGRVLWEQPRAFARAVGGRFVAWCPVAGCGATIRLTDVRSGRTRPIRPPRGLSFRETFAGAVSADGSLLAVDAMTTAGVRWLVLVRTETGWIERAPGSRLDDQYPAISWAPSGWVFFHSGKGRIMAHRPGSEVAIELPARLRREVLQMAAGN